MIAFRWIILALFLGGLAGCGASTDPSRDPAAAALVKSRADRIEQLKAKAATRGARLSR